MYQCNPTDWDKQVKENLEKMDQNEFFNWFDGGETVEGALAKSKDIFTRLVLPVAKNTLPSFENACCVEMGYGSGGMLVEASKFFDHAYGMEWHDCADAVGDILLEGDHGQLYLVHSPKGINMQDDTVDFIYSWLYVNRLGTIEGVRSFLQESYRVLRDGGSGVIFFPRYIRTGKAQSVKQYEGDVVAENADKIGYREGGVTTRVRGISIILSLWKMKEILTEVGFEIAGQTASYDGRGRGKVYHGQHGLIFKKPAPVVEEKEKEDEKVQASSEASAKATASAEVKEDTKSRQSRPAPKKKSSRKSKLRKRK